MVIWYRNSLIESKLHWKRYWLCPNICANDWISSVRWQLHINRILCIEKSSSKWLYTHGKHRLSPKFIVDPPDWIPNVCCHSGMMFLYRKELEQMSVYSEECRKQFTNVLGWLHEWACSRSFGLGTRVPWDKQFLIESLSDSTIYMAYYTVSHILQRGDIYGKSGKTIYALIEQVVFVPSKFCLWQRKPLNRENFAIWHLVSK